MNLFYDSGYFQVILGEERPGFEKVSGSMQGYDITPQKVMNMLTTAQGTAKQSGGDLQSALARLSIDHDVRVFKKPGQEKETFGALSSHYCILFGKEKATFDTLSNFIKTIPEYSNYLIIPYISRPAGDWDVGDINLSTVVARRSDANWHVLGINDKSKEVTVKENPNVIVVNPDNFKIVYSDFPEFNGDLLPALEEIMAPIQFSPILPAQREEFFGKNR